MHIVLIGDSIIDNQAYIQPDDPDVRQQLATLFGGDHTVTRLALDGAVIAGAVRQLATIPDDATHIVISAGGNNLLGQSSMLYQSVSSIGESLMVFAQVLNTFDADYRRMVSAALKHARPLTLCTIYNPNEPNELERTVTRIALSIFNDAILRVAADFGVPVIDLRAVCTDPADFANPIEPSAAGGEKIARAMHTVITQHNFSQQQTMIYH